jgi:predicted RNA binding protein YcfA (HicA-like mRNA interferase family)
MSPRSRSLLSRLLPVTRNELIRRLRKLDFQGPYPGSGHAYMVRESAEERVYVSIPNPHHGKDIGVKLLFQILREAGCYHLN